MTEVRLIASSFFLIVGTIFMFLAALGVFRLPDLFTRMQASTKSATLGIGCMLLGVTFYFGEVGVTSRAVAVIAFFFLTAPVAAHMIGRAAYLHSIPMTKKMLTDELEGRYDLLHVELDSPGTAATNHEVNPPLPPPPAMG